MDERHPVYKALEVARIRTFLCLPPLFFEESLVSSIVVAATSHPEKMNLSDTLLHQVTGLPLQAPDPPKETKLGREKVAREYCETTQDASKSGLRLEGFKNLVYRQVAQLMALKLFGLQLRIQKMLIAAAHTTRNGNDSENACVVIKWLEIDSSESPTGMRRNSARGLLHGQETSLREVEDAKSVKRRKGKSVVVEEQPALSQAHNRTMEEMLQLSTWTEGILEGFIKLDYEGRWKMFEDGLPKEECKMENHELWQPTFKANVINILVRDLVRKVKTPPQSISEIVAKEKNKVADLEAKIDFIYDFMDIWVKDIKEIDLVYKMFLDRFGQTILKEMQVRLCKLGAHIIKTEVERKEAKKIQLKLDQVT
eukprot:Gb_37374 [translate_table: standard]